jgi:hypothetical protein
MLHLATPANVLAKDIVLGGFVVDKTFASRITHFSHRYYSGRKTFAKGRPQLSRISQLCEIF